MRPILLQGHTRSLTKIKYNSDGDLLFTASKDKAANVWYSHNGERLGSFEGHGGSIWDLDVSFDSTRLLTGSADGTCILWNVSNGKILYQWKTEHQNAIRAVAFAEGDRKALYVTDATLGQACTIHIFDVKQDSSKQTGEFEREIVVKGQRASVALWGKLNKTIITGHDKGLVSVWDAESFANIHHCLIIFEPIYSMREKLLECFGEIPTRPEALINSAQVHAGLIQDLQFGPEKEYFITASKDNTAQIIDATTLEVLKRFEADRPVNSAAISPIRQQIMLGGGQDAMNVTTTSAKQGKFEVRFFHLVFKEELGRG
ncbi:hypothetical protein BASA83_010219 [Batrachochytrium salamandrivorans]|nr:hypothetical protein BASA83_010219 [Batrachochytrium salamandrivorans]